MVTFALQRQSNWKLSGPQGKNIQYGTLYQKSVLNPGTAQIE